MKSQPQTPTIASLSSRLPPLIVLCGYAASGKSTFASALESFSPTFFCRVNRDEMRGKGECAVAFHEAISSSSSSSSLSRGQKPKQAGASRVSKCVVVDCCNLTEEKRREWVEMAHGCRAWLIFFDLPLQTCEYRITRRENHPTIPSGPAGLTVLKSMQKQLQRPEDNEKGFERVTTVTCEEDVGALLAEWGIAVDIESLTTSKKLGAAGGGVEADGREENEDDDFSKPLKFPRTSHALNLGAATRDDKVLPLSDLQRIITERRIVVVEEKIDGANMGFSLTRDGKVLVQNRSHYVTSNYHPQFAPLDKWVARHMDDLWSVLTPGRHVLYGEWLFATHSVSYTKLPDLFVAFDLFDREEKKFASRDELEKRLAGTRIAVVPLIYRGPLKSVSHVAEMIDGPSDFNDERREGIVLRTFEGRAKVPAADGLASTEVVGVDAASFQEWVNWRAKSVRADFIAGNERWNRTSKIQKNQTVH